MNSVCITGRLVETPALSTTKTGKSVSTFSVAVRRDRERADFFRCVAWNGTAEHVCKWFRKGQEIAIEGRLQTQSWTDKHGQKRTDVEIVVEEAGFIGKVEAAPAVSAEALNPPHPSLRDTFPAGGEGKGEMPEIEEIADEDLPF